MKSNACPNKKNFFKITSKQLVIGALFAAMTIALKPIDFYFLPTARLNITAVPIILSGITLGPVLGAIVGFIADVLGYVLFDKSGQPLSLLLTLSSVMMGLVPGLIYRFTKKETKSRVKYTLLNGLSFLFLIAMLAVFLSAEGSIKIADGAILALHPISGQWVTLKTWVVFAISGAFLAYCAVLILMLTGKKRNEAFRADKLLFAVTLSVILAEILTSSLGLEHIYAWPLTLILIIRIIKGFLVIPLYTLLAAALYKLILKMKLDI